MDPHTGMGLGEAADLAALRPEEALAQRRDLDVEVESGQVEVGRESLAGPSVAVEVEDEGAGLVFPGHAERVEQFGELGFGRVGEVDHERAARRVGWATGLVLAGRNSTMAASISPLTPARGRTFSTPWPLRTDSVSSSPRHSTTWLPEMTMWAAAISSSRWVRR